MTLGEFKRKTECFTDDIELVFRPLDPDAPDYHSVDRIEYEWDGHAPPCLVLECEAP